MGKFYNFLLWFELGNMVILTIASFKSIKSNSNWLGTVRIVCPLTLAAVNLVQGIAYGKASDWIFTVVWVAWVIFFSPNPIHRKRV